VAVETNLSNFSYYALVNKERWGLQIISAIRSFWLRVLIAKSPNSCVIHLRQRRGHLL